MEHLYGATLITTLLTGDPLTELGADAVPSEVRFQAQADSAVDDYLVLGHTRDGTERRVSIGVRRAPRITSGDKETAKLLVDYVQVVTNNWTAVRGGRWRLALVTASRVTPAAGSRDSATIELGDLAEHARYQGSNTAFRAAVARKGWASDPLRKRLTDVDALVREAAGNVRAAAAIERGELTWRLLSALRVRELRLHGSDLTDRTYAVSCLRQVAGGVPADDLLTRLAELSGRYAPAGARVTREMLLRDLSGLPLAGPGQEREPPSVPVREVKPQLVPAFRPARGARLEAEAPLKSRWRAEEEGRLGDRSYLLLDDKAGLIRADRDPRGGPTRRQAQARQTHPMPAAGQSYAWLRQAGRDLTRERDLLTRAAASGADGLPRVAYHAVAADTVTLALSWPEEKSGLPCPTLRTRFSPGSLDAWQVSLLLTGLGRVATTLQRLHRLGVTHRSLAPEAIIVAANGRFALRDLGLAATGSQPGEGPASYQAPEQAFGTGLPAPGPPTDVYQLAAVAYHLITGRVPARGGPPPHHPALPESAQRLLSASLAVSPADRPPRCRPPGRPRSGWCRWA